MHTEIEFLQHIIVFLKIIENFLQSENQVKVKDRSGMH